MSLIRPHRRTNPSDNAVNHPKHEIHLLRSRWIWCPGQNLIEAISGPVLANSALITDKLRSPWINGRLSLPPSARPVTQPSAELRLLNSTFDQNYPRLLEQKCMIDTTVKCLQSYKGLTHPPSPHPTPSLHPIIPPCVSSYCLTLARCDQFLVHIWPVWRCWLCIDLYN